jgi:hypothetical protein
LVLLAVPAALFAQTDEIQVYNAEIADQGVFNLELHTNYTPIGRKSPDFPGGIIPNHSTIQVTGTFTLHGKPHELTVPMQVHIDGMNCTAKTHFVVPYVKWGLKDPSNFLLKVAKEVEIDLTLGRSLSVGKLTGTV